MKSHATLKNTGANVGHRLIRSLTVLLLLVLVGALQLSRNVRRVHADETLPKLYIDHAKQFTASYRGSGRAMQVISRRQASALSMASEDFDVDGYNDLAIGFAAPGGGMIALHRGNIDAFAPQSRESLDAIGRSEFAAPYLPDAELIEIPIRPDFLASGDFMGHNAGLVVASRGGKTLHVVARGDSGEMEVLQSIDVPGAITGFDAHAVRTGKYARVVVGVHTVAGPRLLIYSGSNEGLTPERSFELSDDATAFAFGNLDGDVFDDMLVLAAGKVSILHGGSQTFDSVDVPFTVAAMTVGRFVFDRSSLTQMSLLGTDGSVHILTHSGIDQRPFSQEEARAKRKAAIEMTPNSRPVPAQQQVRWKEFESYSNAGAFDGAGRLPLMVRTRISDNGADDVMLLGSRRLSVIAHTRLNPSSGVVIDRTDLAADAVAALPLRVNIDGRPGIVLIRRGETVPDIMMPLPDPTFFVNTTLDPSPGSVATTCNNVSNVDVSSSCSLREAVLKANATSGTDTIVLSSGTYALTIGRTATPDYTGIRGALYVNDSVNIVGAGQANTTITWGTPTPSGATKDMIIAVNEDIDPTSDATASISNLTISGGLNGGSIAGFDGDGGCMEYDGGTSGTANLFLTNVTITGCSAPNGNGGGLAIFNFFVPGQGAIATIANSTFSNNTASESGGGGGGGLFVFDQAQMLMTNSQVTGNHANASPATGGGVGGGVGVFSAGPGSPLTKIHATTITGNIGGPGGGLYTSANLLVDEGTIISGNTAQNAPSGNGGGGAYVQATPPDNVTFTNVTISGNSATTLGGGIQLGNVSAADTLTMSFSRLAGNTATTGSNFYNTNGHATVTNNWWGTNTPATTIVNNGASPTTTFDPFIVLSHAAVPQKIRIGPATTTLTADFLHDNHGAAISPNNLSQLVGVAVTFNNAVKGAISSPQATIQANTATISTATISGTTVTITTASTHTFTAGQTVTISGVSDARYNGIFTVTAPVTSNTFNYTDNNGALAGPPALGAATGGTASVPLGTATATFTAGGTGGNGSANAVVDQATVTASITILEPPQMTKAFSPTLIAAGTTSTLTFTLPATNNTVAINANFTDNLPSGLVVAGMPNATNTCGGTFTAVAGATSITYTNPAQGFTACTMSVNVSGAGGTYVNSVTLQSSDAGNALVAATATLTIGKADQTITFGPLPGKTFGDPDFAVNATASSNLPVTFSILSGPATIAGNIVHITGAGVVTVRASQAGDNNFNPAPNVDQPFTVAKANQTITFAPLADKTFGDPPFTVSATGGGSSQPVLFSASGACSVLGNTVTINAAGSCTVTASQAGDSNYNAAADVPRTFTINKGTQAVVTVSAPADATFGQAGLVATASGGSGTGAYSFDATGSTACTVNAVSGAITVTAGTGTCSITASRAGDGNYNASAASAPAIVNIHKAATSTSVVSSLNPSTFGNAVSFTAQVSPATATGTIQFKIDGNNFGGPVIVVGGSATSGATISLTGGNHNVSAVYNGDNNFASSTGSLTQVVNQAASNTTIVSSLNPSAFGQAVTFTATVTSASGVPTGTVTFKDGAAILGSAPVDGAGHAAFATSALVAGTHSITAAYGGDTNFLISTSAPLSQVVAKTNTATSLISSQNPSSNGQAVTFTATTVALAPGGGIPTGGVTFMDGATVLGTTTLNPSGQATFTTTALVPGTHSITATYGGDSNFNGSASASLSQQVFAYLSSGAFIIGDLEAVVGNQVTFAGSQWDQANAMSGSSAPSSFKGFADSTSTTPPSVGGTWTGSTGNSGNAPDTVPTYMAVLVSSSSTKSGSTVTGNIVSIVIVRTDSSTAGTGTVVAVIAP